MRMESLLKRIFILMGAFILMMSGLMGQVLAAEAPATIKLGAVIALTGAMASGGKDVSPIYTGTEDRPTIGRRLKQFRVFCSVTLRMDNCQSIGTPRADTYLELEDMERDI